MQNLKIDTANDTIIYEADVNALNGILVGRTLAEARALGPIVTPKQYQCSYCGTGACGITVNVIQCYCGSIQCQPATTTTGMNVYFYLENEKVLLFLVQPRNPCAANPCKYLNFYILNRK